MPQATFAVAVRFQIKTDHVDEFLATVQKQGANSLRLEPDCHHFDVCVDAQDRSKIFLYEAYTDVVAFETHRQTEHFAQYASAVAPWIENKELSTWTITQC